jgi:hypothetical protein
MYPAAALSKFAGIVPINELNLPKTPFLGNVYLQDHPSALNECVGLLATVEFNP